MRSKETLNKDEVNEITIIYDYNKSKDIDINNDIKERYKKELGETISRGKIVWRKICKK